MYDVQKMGSCERKDINISILFNIHYSNYGQSPPGHNCFCVISKTRALNKKPFILECNSQLVLPKFDGTFLGTQ